MMENYDLISTGGTQVLAFSGYPELEKAADRTAAKIKEGFMEMGYILKVARDTNILAGSRYSGYEEFAEKRYGLDKGTVSRYIRIVERFSVGGNSHVLEEGYRNIGFAKLSLMLHMPDAIAEEITEKYSKAEVQEIKEEIDAEHAVSDIEVAIEAAEEKPEEREKTLLERTVRQIGREQLELYRKLHAACFGTGGGKIEEQLLALLAPQGDAIFMVRLPGMGRLMLSFSGDKASVTNVRSGDKERYAIEDIWEAVMEIVHEGSAEESYLREYGEPMETAPAQENKSQVAPVQQKGKRKESKVTKAAPKKTVVQEKKPVAAVVQKASPQEPVYEPLPGQIELDDYPDVMPDAHYEEIPLQEPDPAVGVTEKLVEEPEPEKDPEIETGEVEGAAETGTDPAGNTEAGLLWEDTEATVMETHVEESAEDLWSEAEGYLDDLKQYFAVWDRKPMPVDFLRKSHMAASGLRTALEKLLDMEEENG